MATRLTQTGEEVQEILNEGAGPFEKGSADNSVVLKGEYQGYKNEAVSQTSMAVGAATIAGLKGWYYSKIDFTNKTITLSDTQPAVLLNALVGGSWSSGTPNIAIDDVISLVNNSKYDLCSKVTAISGNVITVDALPFTELETSLIAANNLDDWSLYVPDRPDAGIIDFGGGAFSEGGRSMATNICAHAEGLQTHAYGQYSHAEGRETMAGYAAHAEGHKTKAGGTYSHAEGQSSIAAGSKSHAEGTQSETYANNSHTEGYKSIIKDGAGAHAEGYGSVIDFTETTTSNDIPSSANKEQSIGAHVEGVNNRAAGIAVHVEGKNNRANGTANHAEGANTRAGVYDAPTENTTSTEGYFAHAEGNSTLAKGNASHAEGAGTQALARASHAEGRHSIASGNYAHAEGFDTFAGDNSGVLSKTTSNITKGYFTHAEGHNTLAQGNSSHAEGKGTKALNTAEHASGKYNISTESADASIATLFSVGCGSSDANRENAFEIKQNGSVYIKGLNRPLQSVVENLDIRAVELIVSDEFDFGSRIPITNERVLAMLLNLWSSPTKLVNLQVARTSGENQFVYMGLCYGDGEITYGDDGGTDSIRYFTADGKYVIDFYRLYIDEEPEYLYKINNSAFNEIAV